MIQILIADHHKSVRLDRWEINLNDLNSIIYTHIKNSSLECIIDEYEI